MPVYEYECKSCKKTYEFMQKFNDPPLETCTVCGGQMQKLISNTSFVLKGNGWYVTDYVRKVENKEDKSNGDKPSAQKAESKSETSSTEIKQASAEPVSKAVEGSKD